MAESLCHINIPFERLKCNVHAGPLGFISEKVMYNSLPPSEEFELTANSLSAHIETHGKLILRTLNYPTVNSQDDSHCELPVSYS